MIYSIAHNLLPVQASINLPASKSIANRALLIRALCETPFEIHNLPDSQDTRVLDKALKSYLTESEINIGHAGTSMRFLTAFLSMQTNREFVLTGSERMKNRPISKLVDGLRMLGADISYLEKDGFPPLAIKGKQLDGEKVVIDGGVSSQYISAILMIAPMLPKGLEMILENEVISASYIRMTLALMKAFGVQSDWQGNRISIKKQPYKPKDFVVESDWSAASYWYQICALSKSADIELLGLCEESFQGDVQVASLFDDLGVNTAFVQNGVRLTKKLQSTTTFSFDFIENPDLVQSFAVTLGLKHIPFHFTGTQTLKIKETDRIEALKAEMLKLGVKLESEDPRQMSWDGATEKPDKVPVIHTYDDHRMAMCFAPAALTGINLLVEDPLVVAKSYPSYWDDLRLAGFQVEVCVSS